MHEYLRHLEAAGFEGAPRVLELTLTASGSRWATLALVRPMVTFLHASRARSGPRTWRPCSWPGQTVLQHRINYGPDFVGPAWRAKSDLAAPGLRVSTVPPLAREVSAHARSWP